MKRWLFLILTFPALAACSADYPLKAYFKAGKLYFDGDGKDWFFGKTGFCPSYLKVWTETGDIVWQIETDNGPVDCKIFPVAYGSLPKGWKAIVAAKPLQSGELYVIKGDGGDAYHGAFRYREQRLLSVENQPEVARRFVDTEENVNMLLD
ncbi:hypothetical protein [Sphingomonas sp. LT1P40]|uniref:hypothetical protein n=1 Tax=Alteristakelama amylovorans TaxID=3096166 RepID=UPI002FC8C7B3